MSTLQEKIENRMKSIFEQQDRLVQIWEDPFIKAVNEYVKAQRGSELTIFEKRNIAQCLENALQDAGAKRSGRLFEATTEDSISFLGIQLPVISALLPTLVLNEIATVQALDRRVGAVFYLNVKAGSTKGSVAAGSQLIGAKTGHASPLAARTYARTKVEDELLTPSETTPGTFEGTVQYAPGLIRMSEIVVKNSNGDVVATCNSSGVISGTTTHGTVTGVIASNGVYTITVASGDSTMEALTISYYYQYDLPADEKGNKTGVAEVDVEIVSETVSAEDFPLRSRYSLGAALDLQKAHGLNLESELIKFLGGEIKFSIDQVGLNLIDAAAESADAADPCTEWDATVKSGQEWLWKKYELLDRFEQGSNNIWRKTLRAVATFIHCGNNVARVLRQMPEFKESAAFGKTPPTGPVVIGEIHGRKVIQNPWKDQDSYSMGWKGDNYLMSGFIYLPYIPLFATPTLVTSDLMAQKGFMSSAAFKVVNPGMFCTGKISHLGTQA